MGRVVRIPFIFPILCLVSYGIFSSNIPYEKISPTLSLRNSFFLQDSKGQLWISSDDKGLNVYNGQELKYYPMSGDGGFKGQWIQGQIIEDSEGTIWTSSYNYLIRIDPKSKKISSIQLNHDSIIAHENYHVIDYDEYKRVLYIAVDYKLFEVPINHLSRPKFLINTKGRRFSTRKNSDNEIIEFVSCLWAEGYGAERIYQENNLWKKDWLIEPDRALTFSKSVYSDNSSVWLVSSEGLYNVSLDTGVDQSFFRDDRINDVASIRSGLFLIATKDNGLYLFDTSSKEKRSILIEGLETNAINYLYSGEQSVYLSIHGRGVFQVAKKNILNYHSNFQQSIINLNSIAFDLKGNPVISSNSGVFTYKDHSVFRHGSYKDRIDNFYFNSDRDLIGVNSQALTNLTSNQPLIMSEKPIEPVLYYNLAYVKNNPAYVTSSHGLLYINDLKLEPSKFNAQTERLTHLYHYLEVDDDKFFFSQYGQGLKLHNNGVISQILSDDRRVNDLHYIDDRLVLIGTDLGLLAYTDSILDTVSVSLESMEVFDISKHRNMIYLVTSEGIFHADNIDGDYVREIEYFPSDNIRATGNGIAISDSLICIIHPEGLYCQRHDETSNQTSFKAKIEIQSILINDQLELLPFVKNHDHISLSYNENNLKIRANVTDLSTPYEAKIYYRMNSNQWVKFSPNNPLQINNLAPDNYQIEFIGENSKNQKSDISSLTFTISPPYWETWWFQTSIVLGLIGIGWAINYSITRRKLVKAQIQLDKQKALTIQRNKIADDLHDELGTELTKILYLSDEAAYSKNDQRKESIIEEISDLAVTSIQNMREMMWILDDRNKSLSDLISKIRSNISGTLQDYPIESRFDFDNPLPDIHLDTEVRRQILLILKEATHNVIKHSKASILDIEVSTHSDQLEIIIKDNGIGFENISDNGRGMNSMTKRANSIGAELQIKSNVEQGTSIRLLVNHKRV